MKNPVRKKPKNAPENSTTTPLVFGNPCPLSVLKPLSINKASPLSHNMKDPFLFYIDFPDQIQTSKTSQKPHDNFNFSKKANKDAHFEQFNFKKIKNKENLEENSDLRQFDSNEIKKIDDKVKFAKRNEILNNPNFGYKKSRNDHLREILAGKNRNAENKSKNILSVTSHNWKVKKLKNKSINQKKSYNKGNKKEERSNQKFRSVNLGPKINKKINTVKPNNNQTLKESLQTSKHITKTNFRISNRENFQKLIRNQCISQNNLKSNMKPRMSVRNLTKPSLNNNSIRTSNTISKNKTKRAKASIPRIKRPSFRRSQPRTIKQDSHQIQLVSLRRLSVKSKNSKKHNLFKALWKKNTKDKFSKTFHRTWKKRPISGNPENIKEPISLGARFNTEIAGGSKKIETPGLYQTDALNKNNFAVNDYRRMTIHGGFKISFNTETDNFHSKITDNDNEEKKDLFNYFDNDVIESLTAKNLKKSQKKVNLEDEKQKDSKNCEKLEKDLWSQGEDKEISKLDDFISESDFENLEGDETNNKKEVLPEISEKEKNLIETKIKQKKRNLEEPTKSKTKAEKRLKNMTTIHWQTKPHKKTTKKHSKSKNRSMPINNSKPNAQRGKSFQLGSNKTQTRLPKTLTKLKRQRKLPHSLKTTLNLTQIFGLSRELTQSPIQTQNKPETENEISHLAKRAIERIENHETSLMKTNLNDQKSALSFSISQNLSKENHSSSKVGNQFEDSLNQTIFKPDKLQNQQKNEQCSSDNSENIEKSKPNTKDNKISESLKDSERESLITGDLKMKARGMKESFDLGNNLEKIVFVSKRKRKKSRKRESQKVSQSKKRKAKKVFFKSSTLGGPKHFQKMRKKEKINPLLEEIIQKKGNFLKKQKPLQVNPKSTKNRKTEKPIQIKREIKTMKNFAPEKPFPKQKENQKKSPKRETYSKRNQDNPTKSPPNSHILKNIRNIKNLKRPVFSKSKTEQLPKKSQFEGPPSVYMKSGDVHLKKFLKRAGVEVRSSIVRTRLLAPPDAMKYVAQDQMKDYRRLRENQIFNHFEGNEEITEKNGLNRNMNRRQILSGGEAMFKAIFRIQKELDENNFGQTKKEISKPEKDLEIVNENKENVTENILSNVNQISVGHNQQSNNSKDRGVNEPAFKSGTGQAENPQHLELVQTPSKEPSGTGDNSCQSSYKKLNNFWKTRDFLFSPDQKNLIPKKDNLHSLPTAFSPGNKIANFKKKEGQSNSQNIKDKEGQKIIKDLESEFQKHEISKEDLANKFLDQDFYPETYDFSSQDQRDRFIENFFFQTTFVILKKHVQYFTEKRPQLTSRLTVFLKKRQRKTFEKKLEGQLETDSLYVPVYSSKYVKLSDEKKDKNFVVNVFMLGQLIEIWKMIKQKLTGLENELHSFNHRKLDLETRKRFESLSLHPPSYHTLSHSERTTLGLSPEYWKTPSSTLILYLIDFHLLFSSLLPHYSLHSPRNLWIVKPGCKSKGIGIFVTEDLAKIKIACRQNPNRLVQKYVEDPLLIENRKFDIRVWVLIEELDPLRVWVFDDFYLRFCSREYDDQKLDLTRHLTNYAINKGRFGGRVEQSAMSRDEFFERIDRSHSIASRKLMTTQIQNLILTTIKQCQPKMRPRNASFELLGFDILIRKDLSPVLLEVNLSPACAGRTPYLLRNLDQMSSGLMAILTHKLKNTGNQLAKWLSKIGEKQNEFGDLNDQENIEQSKNVKEEIIKGMKENCNSTIENKNQKMKEDFVQVGKDKLENKIIQKNNKQKEESKPKKNEKWKIKFKENLETLERYSPIKNEDSSLSKIEHVFPFQSEPIIPNSYHKENYSKNKLIKKETIFFQNNKKPETKNCKKKKNENSKNSEKSKSDLDLMISGWRLIACQKNCEEHSKIIGNKTDLAVHGKKLDIKKEMRREERIRRDYYARVLQKFFRNISERKWYQRMQKNLLNMGAPTLDD